MITMEIKAKLKEIFNSSVNVGIDVLYGKPTEKKPYIKDLKLSEKKVRNDEV